jgi:maltose alpha-D-glucosyltransferase / alpha-amylase
MTEVASRGARAFEEEHREDSLWYKDAIIYQLHVKSFRDGNADG